MSLKYTLHKYKEEYGYFGTVYVLKSIWGDVTYPVVKLFRFGEKLCTYGKLLWNDYEFDFDYLLRVLQLKMHLMSVFMETKGVTESSVDKAKELQMCVDIIERLLNHDYDKEGQDELERKYGELIFDHIPTDNPKFTELKIYRSRAPEGTPEYDVVTEETRKVYLDAEERRRKDIELLFDTMKDKLETWWD